MTKQVQQRGAIAATQNARVLAARERDTDTTNWRGAIHDGSTAGGHPQPNAADAQKQTYTAATATGTDAIAATYAWVPSAYAARMKFGFIAANNNTGAATFNANSVGAVTIKKVQDGALVDLEADDIVADAYYEVTYNGTYFILSGGIGGGASAGKWIAEQTAAISSSLDFDSVFRAGYDYEIHFRNLVPVGSGRDLGVRFTDDNGATFETSNYDHCYVVQSGATATPTDGDTSFAIDVGVVSTGAGATGLCGILRLFNPANNIKTDYTYDFTFDGMTCRGGGQYTVAIALTGFQARETTTGNLESGSVAVKEIPRT